MKKILYIIVFLLVCVSVQAKNLYVSTTGSDAVTYANNDIDSPWLTPLKAWTEADAGDTVYFRGGTYVIGAQIITKFIGNSGTAESPITYTSYTGEQAVFSTELTSRIFGIQQRYNIVDGINFTGSTPTWFYLGEDLPADGLLHFTVKNCTVSLASSTDNAGFVMTSPRSDYTTIENCTIEGPAVANSTNASGLYLESSDYLTVKNNVISRVPIGLYFKFLNGGNTGNEIYGNYIYNCSRNSIQTNSVYTNIHDNIIGADCGSFQINESNGGAGGDNNTINHNTIFSGGILLDSTDTGADNNTITNNIISSYTACCDGNSWDYNMYVSGAAIGANDLANTSPTYIGGATPTTIAEFALTAESAGYLAGSDSKDIGADVSLVGIVSESPTSTTITLRTNSAGLILTHADGSLIGE